MMYQDSASFITRFCYTLLVLLLCAITVQASARDCHLTVHYTRQGDVYYDLSPLTVTTGKNYRKVSDNGRDRFYFNFCERVTEGGCHPYESVCRVGDAPHGVGSARHFSLEEIEDHRGVRVKYKSEEGCAKRGGVPRESTINVYCNENATSMIIESANEVDTCNIVINVQSVHGCPRPAPYDDMPAPPVNIFLVVHSHDDVGWTSTINDYYSQKVKPIIDGMVRALPLNSSRKFIQVEQAFFNMWWNDQKTTDAQRGNATLLVKNGQLAFVMGGWVMPDEATPSYSSVVTQLAKGHTFLQEKFGVTPEVGWHIDPFGSTSAIAELYKFSNFKGHVIDRIPEVVKANMMDEKMLQFQWKFSSTRDTLLTHILDTLYCFPYSLSPDGLKIDYEMSDFDVIQKANFIVTYARNKAMWTRTPNVLISVGCDFAFAGGNTAELQFAGLDKVISYVTNRSKELNVVGIQYSDLKDYFDELSKSKKDIPEYSGDFMPYNDDAVSWWTGFYTSRPKLKGLVRKSESVLRSSETLFSIAKIANNNQNTSFKSKSHTYSSQIDKLLQAISVNTHHDAVAGTSKPGVVRDYMELLNAQLPNTQNLIAETLGSLSSSNMSSVSTLQFSDTISTKTNTLIPVVVYNSLPWTRADYVKLNLNDFDASVQCGVVDAKNNTIKSQIVSQDSQNTLFFKVNLPPMGYRTYFVNVTHLTTTGVKRDINSLGNAYLSVNFSSNQINRVSALNNTLDVLFQQKFMMYTSYSGAQNSGAYIFSPAGDAVDVSSTAKSTTTWATGDLLSDAYQVFGDGNDISKSYIKQHVRMFADDDEFMGNFIELSQTIGPLPRVSPGKELITRFSTAFMTNVSYTDNNGLRFFRREYNSDMRLPVPGNYYPTVYASYVVDSNYSKDKKEMAVAFTFDRTHGITSVNGNIDIMLHRRILQDDGRGLEEGVLDDDTIIDPSIRIVFGDPNDIVRLVYRHAYLHNFPVAVAIGAPLETPAQWTELNINTSFSMLKADFPENVHLLDFKSTDEENNIFIMRLVHLFSPGEHKTLSSSATLNVDELFAEPYCISSINETTLTGNPLANAQTIYLYDDPTITLQPAHIKTFLVKVEVDTKDRCIGIECGDGHCENIKCSYRCKCQYDFMYNKQHNRCVNPLFLDPESSKLINYLPLTILAYLTFACVYRIRSEFTRLYGSKSSSSPLPSSGFHQFMNVHNTGIEKFFFPASLRSRHRD